MLNATIAACSTVRHWHCQPMTPNAGGQINSLPPKTWKIQTLCVHVFCVLHADCSAFRDDWYAKMKTYVTIVSKAFPCYPLTVNTAFVCALWLLSCASPILDAMTHRYILRALFRPAQLEPQCRSGNLCESDPRIHYFTMVNTLTFRPPLIRLQHSLPLAQEKKSLPWSIGIIRRYKLRYSVRVYIHSVIQAHRLTSQICFLYVLRHALQLCECHWRNIPVSVLSAGAIDICNWYEARVTDGNSLPLFILSDGFSINRSNGNCLFFG